MFTSFASRSHETERLDRGEFTAAEYARWHREMWFIHRLFGEAKALRRALVSDASQATSRISILDIGAGSGSLLGYLRNRLSRGDVVSVGLEMSHEAAGRISQKGHFGVRGSALDLPFADRSFDYVFCTLFLHHLSGSEAIDLIREMRRVTRKKLIVVDLERSAASYVAFRTLGTFFLQRFTLDDGSLSIKRAFSQPEIEELARGSGLTNFKVERSAIGRLILTSDGA